MRTNVETSGSNDAAEIKAKFNRIKMLATNSSVNDACSKNTCFTNCSVQCKKEYQEEDESRMAIFHELEREENTSKTGWMYDKKTVHSNSRERCELDATSKKKR